MERLPLRIALLPCISVPMVEMVMKHCLPRVSHDLRGYIVYGFFHKDSFGEYDQFDEPQTLIEFLDEVASHIEDSLENETINERAFRRLNAELEGVQESCKKVEKTL